MERRGFSNIVRSERERERDHGADFQVQIIDGIDTGRDQSHESHEAMTG